MWTRLVNAFFLRKYFYHLYLSSYTENLTDGCWSPTRPSVFFTARHDGVLDAWDILYQQKSPILSIKVSDDAVNCLKVEIFFKSPSLKYFCFKSAGSRARVSDGGGM